jgi:hypothetical protein
MAASLGRYDIGDLVRLRATYVSTDLVTPADPSTITFLTLSGAGTVASYQFTGGAGGGSITRVAAGAYYKDVTVDVYGTWTYRAIGTGGVQAAEEWQFSVDQSKFSL